MIGQTKLLTKLNSYSINNFPNSVILLGEEGSGKHIITKYISDNILKLPLLDITANVTDEYINEIYLNPNPCIYLIDVTQMLEKEQNILLKLIEEPLANSFLILLSNNKNNLLNTIYNRCVPFELDLYSRDELKTFIKDNPDADLILNVVRTPGRLLNLNFKNINEIYDVCGKIVNKLQNASLNNTLSISNKINYKDEYNKFDLDLFFDTLIYSLHNTYIFDHNSKSLDLYLLTVDYRKRLLDKRLNKQVFFENYLINLWKEVRE